MFYFSFVCCDYGDYFESVELLFAPAGTGVLILAGYCATIFAGALLLAEAVFAWVVVVLLLLMAVWFVFFACRSLAICFATLMLLSQRLIVYCIFTAASS